MPARRLVLQVWQRKCERLFVAWIEPTGPARSGTPDDKLREIQEEIPRIAHAQSGLRFQKYRSQP
jgi:hypothetical protein